MEVSVIQDQSRSLNSFPHGIYLTMMMDRWISSELRAEQTGKEDKLWIFLWYYYTNKNHDFQETIIVDSLTVLFEFMLLLHVQSCIHLCTNIYSLLVDMSTCTQIIQYLPVWWRRSCDQHFQITLTKKIKLCLRWILKVCRDRVSHYQTFICMWIGKWMD